MKPRLRLSALLSLATAIMVLGLVTAACGSQIDATGQPAATLHKKCVAGTNLDTLSQFESLVGSKVNCADIYDDAAGTWSEWDSPWFIDNHITADNWVPFAANPNDQLIITLGLIPDSVVDTNWRAAGAGGDYTRYAKILARNLVKAHMGKAVIRLATEANGTWEKDSLGSTQSEWKQWVRFWRQTALAMRSVPGAHFDFNWCINDGYQPIPFADYYPGNDVVNSIGVDVYDTAPSGTANRFAYVEDESGGLAALAAFARKEDKPLTIPEWGLLPPSEKGDGDDPSFVTGLAHFIESTPVASESYFFDGGSASALSGAPLSLKVYRSEFNAVSGAVSAKQ